MKIFIFIEWALFHSQSLCYVINIYIVKYISFCRYIKVIEVKITFVFFIPNNFI